MKPVHCSLPFVLNSYELYNFCKISNAVLYSHATVLDKTFLCQLTKKQGPFSIQIDYSWEKNKIPPNYIFTLFLIYFAFLNKSVY